MYRIFVVEDDHALANSICRQIESWGDEAVCVKDFRRVTEEFIQAKPHLVLLDISLPFFDGYYWCNELRKRSSVPILFLSSASEPMNIVMAMNMGGDEFLGKPIDPVVMTAKIRAILRRVYEMKSDREVLQVRGAILNISDGVLEYQGNRIELTKNEFRILTVLLEQRGRTVRRETLMMRLWEDDEYIEENTLTVNVNRLRKKLSAIGLTDCIKTQVGSGYRLEEQE